MQNVVLGALAYNLTESAVFVGIMTAAQLGPLLLFSVVGGMLADAFDRKKLLMILSVQQAAFSIILALVTIPGSPNKAAMVGVVFCIGVGNALYAPIFSAVVPVLVPRRDMSGAIALNSVQMNASRVVGPAIGTTIYAATAGETHYRIITKDAAGKRITCRVDTEAEARAQARSQIY